MSEIIDLTASPPSTPEQVDGVYMRQRVFWLRRRYGLSRDEDLPRTKIERLDGEYYQKREALGGTRRQAGRIIQRYEQRTVKERWIGASRSPTERRRVADLVGLLPIDERYSTDELYTVAVVTERSMETGEPRLTHVYYGGDGTDNGLRHGHIVLYPRKKGGYIITFHREPAG